MLMRAGRGLAALALLALTAQLAFRWSPPLMGCHQGSTNRLLRGAGRRTCHSHWLQRGTAEGPEHAG